MSNSDHDFRLFAFISCGVFKSQYSFFFFFFLNYELSKRCNWSTHVLMTRVNETSERGINTLLLLSKTTEQQQHKNTITTSNKNHTHSHTHTNTHTHAHTYRHSRRQTHLNLSLRLGQKRSVAIFGGGRGRRLVVVALLTHPRLRRE